MEVVIWFVGMLVGMLLVFALMRGGKKPLEVQLSLMNEEVIRLREKEQQLQNEKLQLISETERLKESGRQMEEKLTFQKQEMGEIREMMTAQFRNLAGEILEDKSRRFTETNRENIEKILQPLNKDIAEFRKKVDEAYHKEATERTVLERKIAELVQLNNQIRVDAVNLTNALKGNVKTQGDWGEMILERILENSGLTKGREYFVQETLKDENNRVLHSVRKHIDELANKNYDSWAGGTLDFVMMFIPNEASYVLAMQHDSSLWSDAYRKRVLLLSPANLIASLKLTADLWSREYQNRNALEIADRGAKLYDKCVSFLESFTSIGDSIRKTQTVYEQALGRLSTGGGNLISQTLKLRELGVKSKKGEKEIPKELLPDEEQESQK